MNSLSIMLYHNASSTSMLQISYDMNICCRLLVKVETINVSKLDSLHRTRFLNLVFRANLNTNCLLKWC